MATLHSRIWNWWDRIYDGIVEELIDAFNKEEIEEIAGDAGLPSAMSSAAERALEQLGEWEDEEDADVMDDEPNDDDDQLVAPTSIEESEEKTAQLKQPKKKATSKKATKKRAVKKKAFKKKVTKKKAAKKKSTKKKAAKKKASKRR